MYIMRRQLTKIRRRRETAWRSLYFRNFIMTRMRNQENGETNVHIVFRAQCALW